MRDEGEKNVGQMERVLMGFLGPWLVGMGLRRRSLGGLLLASGGAVLLHRGVTGRCKIYERLGISTTAEAAFRGVDVRRTITIGATPNELYGRWRNLENLPSILGHIESVRERGDGRSHWVARMGPMSAEWDAELVADDPGSRLAWRTTPDSSWTHSGDVTFRPAPGGRGTEMTVHLRIAPRAGRMMLRAGPIFRGLSRMSLGAELRRFKQLVETGEIATNAMRPEDLHEEERRGITEEWAQRASRGTSPREEMQP